MVEQNLWAPWRIGYVRDLAGGEQQGQKLADRTCFLCQVLAQPLDEQAMAEHLVLVADQRGVLMLNRYPYTNGHLLSAPREHVAELSDLTADQRAGMLDLAELGSRLLGATMNPQGMNIGMNIGRCAGAGLPGHLHMHVVPRWNGDVNFMHTIGGVRVIPQALEQSYQWLKQALNERM